MLDQHFVVIEHYYIVECEMKKSRKFFFNVLEANLRCAFEGSRLKITSNYNSSLQNSRTTLSVHDIYKTK